LKQQQKMLNCYVTYVIYWNLVVLWLQFSLKTVTRLSHLVWVRIEWLFTIFVCAACLPSTCKFLLKQ